jgi:hypothetical protein
MIRVRQKATKSGDLYSIPKNAPMVCLCQLPGPPMGQVPWL